MPPKTGTFLEGREWVSNVTINYITQQLKKDSSISLSLSLHLSMLFRAFFFFKIQHKKVWYHLLLLFFRSYFITETWEDLPPSVFWSCKAAAQQQQIASFSSTCNCCFFSVKVCWLSHWGCHTIHNNPKKIYIYLYIYIILFIYISIENKLYIYIYMNPIWLTIGFVLYSFVGKSIEGSVCKINPFFNGVRSRVDLSLLWGQTLLLGCSSNYSTSYIYCYPFVVKALTK